ncbi:VCBS domain-containing protein [Jeongeupia wiesaeckerbachi]
MALEPRILFDGAAAVAVDQQHHGNADAAAAVRPVAAIDPRDVGAGAQAPAPRNLVVVDARLENRDALLAQLPADSKAIIVNAGDDALAAISNALSSLGKVDSIQIFSHGTSGQFDLGNRVFTSETIRQATDVLSSWRGALNSGADIQLYGCNVGAGTAGRTLVQLLASETGADVGASSDNSGNAAAGGNWALEVTSGVIDKQIALSERALSSFDGLLASATPTLSLGSAGADTLIGDQLSFTLSLSNPSTQPGYAPFIDLFMPATGKDGDDGVSFVSASYLGHQIKSFVLTFDASGQVTHPLAKDPSGNALVINAADYGLRAGDQLVVLQVPFGSVSNGQPNIDIQVTAKLSNLADTAYDNSGVGGPDLTIQARSGFQFGNDALDNPTQDPSLVEQTLHDYVVHPTLVKLTQSVDMPEGETPTGPNYVHSETVTVSPANGQTISNVTITQTVPDQVQVTRITPGAGGTLASVTLKDGRVLTDPTAINAAIASDAVFISAYSVTYVNLSGPSSTVVQFYVPDSDAAGAPVLNANSGDARTITFGAPTASGQWVPLDPRDRPTSGGGMISFSGTGDGTGAAFVAKSITLLKNATIQIDQGTAGLTPGDTLSYKLQLAISDYFAYGGNLLDQGEFKVVDTLGDGQTLTGTPTLSFTVAGVTRTVNLIYTSSTDAAGVTTITFDIKASIQQAQQLGALVGDLAADDFLQGATGAVIAYSAFIAQSYTGNYTQKAINEGDAVGNNATVTATVLLDRINLGSTESDSSSTTTKVATNTVDIEIDQVNDGTPPASGELRPGDEVTFSLRYDLVTGDYENLKIAAYLPLPLFDVSTINWSNGGGVGQWELIGGADGNTNLGAFTVTSGPGNSVVFDFGSLDVNSLQGSRIAIRFTVRVGDVPFADQRTLAVTAQSTQQTTIDHTQLVSTDAVAIESIAEPVLDIRHGVVSSSGGTITGSSGTWGAPGSTGVPFGGSVTSLDAVNGDVTGIDAGDRLRLATAIENSGGGGAFDATIRIDIPAGLSFDGGSLGAANLQVYRGDGSLMVLGTDYSVSGNVITFLDKDGQASLLAGRSGTDADVKGSNIVVITYDVRADAAIAASATLSSTSTLTKYASVNNGADFTPTDLVEKAGEQVAAPSIRVGFAGGSLDNGDSSAAHTTGNNVVIGESMGYDIIVTLPEGSTQNLRVDELVPTGMRLDPSFNNGLGYELITTSAGSAALGADFAGSVSITGLTGISGTLGDNGVNARFTFGVAAASADNNAGNNSFVIRVRLIADNSSANQAGKSLQNNASLNYSDPDGDTANGSSAVIRTVSAGGSKPSVIVREPTLTVEQSTIVSTPVIGVDEGDTVEYVLTIRNGSGTTDFDAFDLSLSDALPAQLNGLTLLGVTYADGATNNGGVDFEIVNGVLRTVNGANIDIVKGGSITLRFSGVVNGSAASLTGIDNTATITWTSLNGSSNTSADPAGERTGADGVINGGTLNDYRQTNTFTQKVAQALRISRVGGLPDTPVPSQTDATDETVAVGEIIRYRVVSLVPEGQTDDYSIRVTLDQGLSFVAGDNTALLAFIANQLGISSSNLNLVTGGTLDINGNQNSDSALSINPGLQGGRPQGVINGQYIEITTDAQGRQVITFHLGTLLNRDNDADFEGLSLEFNVRVDNVAASAAGARLGVRVEDFSGNTMLPGAHSLYENVVEPNFGPLDKTVTAFNPNPGSSTGTATVTLSFTQTGTADAYDIALSDGYPQGSNTQAISVEINGVLYTIGSSQIPPEYGFSTSVSNGTITAHFDRLATGTTVRFVYQTDLPNATTIASTDARLSWSSLPETFTSWGGSAVGSDGSATGERNDSGGVNNYVRVDGAGLGVISGTLWNDTPSADTSTTPDGAGLQGQTVTLTWGGLDNNLATTADNQIFTTTTDVNGQYRFGVLASGTYRIDTPTGTISYTQPVGDLKVRIDSDGGTLGQIGISLGEGSAVAADAGYVEQNDAPVNQMPAGPASGAEDTQFAINGITISDLDAERDPLTGDRQLQVTLTVLHGTLTLATTPPGVTIPGGQGSATLVLQGRLADLNAALAQLRYQGIANFNGSDTLTVKTTDNGNFGDADGDGTPGEVTQDALTDTDTLQITVVSVNDAPVAANDSALAVEAGGLDNDTVGVDPQVNVLGNDSDVDTDPNLNANPDRLRVSAAGLQGSGATTVQDGGDAAIVGVYGTLYIASNGSARYVVDNDDPDVQALRTSGDILTEHFDYTISDLQGATSSATLTVDIHGVNDTPHAFNDIDSAKEAGGTNNSSGGSDASGNVLSNDTEVDGGDTQRVIAVTDMLESEVTDMSDVTTIAAGSSATIAGKYGTITLHSDGSYTYQIDNANPEVQKLLEGGKLVDHFTYLMRDTDGLRSVAQLDITVNGTNDAPVATDDTGEAQVASTDPLSGGQELNAQGNVITLASHPDAGAGDGRDSDIDHDVDQLKVSGIRAGAETDGGVLSGVTTGTTSANGTEITTVYGTLRIGADGSYLFDVDSSNVELQSLQAGQTKTVVFTYELKDPGGLTDLAQITITIHGVNDPPVAQNIGAIAVEKGGEANGTLGKDPSGDAVINNFDPDGDPITVSGVRTGKEADAPSITDGTGVGATLQGQYGTLTLGADGKYTYAVDNANTTVQALRTSSQVVIDYFTYTITDGKGGFDSATVAVVVRGQNDNPVATVDTAGAVEAGGVNNGIPGADPSGNVLSNDNDVDAGDTKAVLDVRTGGDSAAGTVGTVGAELKGQYGWLTLNADGSYSYRVDNASPAVQAMLANSTPLVDVFGYTVVDTAGGHGPGSFATLTITIVGANDAPVANNDVASAVEAGGVSNGTAGLNPQGNVLGNDTDVDSVANGETKTVSGVAFGSRNGTVGSALAGDYGSLVLNTDGSYSYLVNNDDPRVQALRQSGETLTETFTYTMRDKAGASSTATLTVTIDGRDDNPVVSNDTTIAVEAGGTLNGTLGSAGTGNVLSNDTDVDAGDTRSVTGVQSVNVAGDAVHVVAIGAATILQGQYGTLTLNADGSYSYAIDNSLAAVQALKPGQSLNDVFNYGIADALGALATGTLTVEVRGAWDAPVGVDDTGMGITDNGGRGKDAFNPTGNVLSNDTDVDANDSKTVTGIRTGAEAVGGALDSVDSSAATQIQGLYGTLFIRADGTYEYVVDVDNPVLQTLGPLQFVQDVFTYEVSDGGNLHDLAQLTLSIRGRNDAPVGNDVDAGAIEASGVDNAQPGLNPSGNVLANDTDLEGDALSVSALRTGNETGSGTAGTLGSPLRGLYGTLTMAADGSWHYEVDNTLPAVQALRISGQTLQDVFTYTVEDVWGLDDTAELRITIDGRNDTSVARDDAAAAVEAGGIANGKPGVDPSGNVLDNDSDVDSVANGEIKQVVGFSNSDGVAGDAGGSLAGRYGRLTLNADGSYTYAVDNGNPAVEALRASDQPLTDVFTYRMRDAAGAVVEARLVLSIQGANDVPVARDDSSVADGDKPAPQTVGNVLPNDSDVDANDALTVVKVRTGAEADSGQDGALGQPLKGRYGTLILNADGSYTYEIDMSNPDVLAASGFGQILHDDFTYTISDQLGAQDQATLVIHLSIPAPYVAPPDGPDVNGGAYLPRDRDIGSASWSLPDVDPTVYVTPTVRDDAIVQLFESRQLSPSQLDWRVTPEILSESIGAGLGQVNGQFVTQVVKHSQLQSDMDLTWILSRHGRVSLTADGLLSDPSIYAPLRAHLADMPAPAEKATPATKTASGFKAQLRHAADKLHPASKTAKTTDTAAQGKE